MNYVLTDRWRYAPMFFLNAWIAAVTRKGRVTHQLARACSRPQAIQLHNMLRQWSNRRV
jgi:hypothetical protein